MLKREFVKKNNWTLIWMGQIGNLELDPIGRVGRVRIHDWRKNSSSPVAFVRIFEGNTKGGKSTIEVHLSDSKAGWGIDPTVFLYVGTETTSHHSIMSQHAGMTEFEGIEFYDSISSSHPMIQESYCCHVAVARSRDYVGGGVSHTWQSDGPPTSSYWGDWAKDEEDESPLIRELIDNL